MLKRLIFIPILATLLSSCSHFPKIKAPKLPTLKMPNVSMDGLKDAVNPVPEIKRWYKLNGFQWVDKNHDGLIDYTEFKTAADKDPDLWLRASENDAHIADFIASEFKRADANRDSRISPEEFLAAG